MLLFVLLFWMILIYAPFIEEDIRLALFQMPSCKTPGIDGMPALFFKKFWGFLSREVVKLCLNVLNEGGALESSINHTLISLIPKVGDPRRVTDFRLITLCIVIYTIISKAIKNRLKLILPDVITESQNAFVPQPQIVDNIICAQEVITP